MESRDTLNGAVRVKEEPSDVSLSENVCKMIDEKPDLKNLQLLSHPLENSINILRKCDIKLENELDDEVEVVAECEDVKPNIHLLAVNKVEEDSQNFLQDLKDTDGYKIQNSIRIETAEGTKPKNERNKKSSTEELSNEDNPKAQIGTVHDGTANVCEICGKKLAHTSSLRRHVKSLHQCITHSCDKCEKSFTQKCNLKIHIETVHNGIYIHACDVCGKTFSHRRNVRNHIESVHNGVKHACVICGKIFNLKGSLKKHMDKVHNDINHSCDRCGRKYSRKSNLKKHIDAVHRSLITT
ncbi:zinc finger protein 710-like [Trichogramma pretiosum]|uniref:zinc finger protein 710-like n=1 Tax=Trichogramma pretiosum TaxID=7493 RepID=UPI0006C963E4|nr:zinc finger protein 710-like [Trichogramma pretiosum]